MNEEKRADNTIEYNNNAIKKINNEIDNCKKDLENIDKTRELSIEITKDFKKLIDLLSISVKGPRISSTFDEILSNNSATLAKIDGELNEKEESVKNQINDLEKQKSEYRNKKDERDKSKLNGNNTY